jgi:hypothetical protein
MDTTDEPLPGLADVLVPEAPSLKPLAERPSPAVWVHKLAVYSKWPPSPETRLREVELRRGLNVIWARPAGENAAASRLAGHGAGKTMFCRLIRYVLDEANPGTTEFRESFEGKLGIGWVLAEVYLADKRWLVGRPIMASSGGYHPFAVEGGSLTDTFSEKPSRAGYPEYRTALGAAVFGGMKLRTLPDSRKPLDWQRLIQWLSRDQEAHLSSLTDWRHKDSESGSPEISADDRANLIRVILGLVESEEQDLLTQLSQKSADHEAKVRDRPKREFAVERAREALSTALGMPVDDPKDSVLLLAIEGRVKNLVSQADASVKDAEFEKELDGLIQEVTARKAEWGFAQGWAAEIEEAVDLEDARSRGVQPPVPKPKSADNIYRQTISGLGPFPGYCSHLMDNAWKAGCKIAHERKPDAEVVEAITAVAAKPVVDQTKLAELRAELKRRQEITAPKKAAYDSAQALLNSARARHRQEITRLKEPARQAAALEALHNAFQTACSELEAWNKAIETLDGEKRDLENRRESLTKQHRKMVEHFTQLFHHVSREMLEDAVVGRVEFAGRSIVPRLSYNGNRDSAALKVTKWVAFDLAALALGMTNKDAHHPRFLLHDSPRESDLAPLIYGGLFLAAQGFEAATDGEPAFQYIVTTTEPPPNAVKKAPWLRLELDASVPEGRFLGMNL